MTPGGGLDTQASGIFPDRYAFAVPADITSAALTVNATDIVATYGSSSVTTNFPPAHFQIRIPSPAAPVAAGAVSTPRHYDTIGNAPSPTAGSPFPSRSHQATGTPKPLNQNFTPADVTIAVLLAAAAIVGGLVYRRTQTRRQPAANPAGAGGSLLAEPRSRRARLPSPSGVPLSALGKVRVPVVDSPPSDEGWTCCRRRSSPPSDRGAVDYMPAWLQPRLQLGKTPPDGPEQKSWSDLHEPLARLTREG